ncbi:MAG TPA: hypothetical protein VKB76_06670, partial [Ktedonobacterales bacterium]|nr:hypothetical protein [Ktedonobacterales bacterium]
WFLWSSLAPPLDTEMILAIAALASALLAAIWWVWWRLPQRQVARLSLKIRDPKDRADIEDNFRKTVGQALGGAAVLVGAAAAYLQFTQQQRASHDLLASSQISKGFEQLMSATTPIRIAGILTLQGAANSSVEYRPVVQLALCAYVGDRTVGKPFGMDEDLDIKTALIVLGQWIEGDDVRRLCWAKPKP